MGCNYSREITGAIPDIHFWDEKKYPDLKEVGENKKKKLSGFFLLNRKRGKRYDYVVLEDGKVIHSSKSSLIDNEATVRDGKWNLWYGMGYTRLYYPLYRGNPMEIFQGSPNGKIHGFFLGPNGPSGASFHYGLGGFYTVDEEKVEKVKHAVRVKSGKTVSIWVDGFPLLVKRQDEASVQKLLGVAKDDLKCESYSRHIALQLSLDNCPKPRPRKHRK